MKLRGPQSKLNTKEKQALFSVKVCMLSVKYNMGVKDALCPLCKISLDTQYHLLNCICLHTPEPWNIQSVLRAIRQREILIERENELTNNPGVEERG